MLRKLLIPFCLFMISSSVSAAVKTISARTQGLQRIDGFIPLYWSAEDGKMLMEISRFGEEFLYQLSLPTGVGSNPVGLDRNQLGDTHIVYFDRIGPKVLLVEPNYRFRALSPDPEERRAVTESFAQSVLWGFTVEAADGNRVLVDATEFLLRDAHGVITRLRERQQGRYTLDPKRSAFYLERTKGFPKNTEIETTLTFSTDEAPGALVRGVAPVAQAITVRQHHSFVELPDAGYRPRELDPRVGVFAIDFYDYATPLTERIEQHWIVRHRLEKTDPSAAVSTVKEPIVYFVDRGTPEPIRSALIEGASWWGAAFEAAGFRDAYRVELLPAGVDPMDVRYNMITWVHRSTRGWSYGGSVVDPRTGEIIKGNVSLGSLRVRQDYLLGTGMIPPFKAAMSCGYESPETIDEVGPAVDSAAMAVARIRQLSAHEVGHTLGLAHNFAASTYGRASVMDYPAPFVKIRDGKLDFSEAYARGVGAYDIFAIRYAYTQFAPGVDERRALDELVTRGVSEGMLFLTDEDARPPGAAHPLANLWDNGSDPVAMLRHEMEVRRIAIAQFGLKNIPERTPLSLLEAKFLPLYLHHRYQLQAAAKSVGGVFYTYAVKTSSGPNPDRVVEPLSAAKQKEALDAVLDTLAVDELRIAERVLALLPPRAFGWNEGTSEWFPGRTDPLFDPIGAATIAADLAISPLLQSDRAARLVDLHSRTPALPGFDAVAGALIARTWGADRAEDAHGRAIQRAVQSLLVRRLTDLARDVDAASDVRAIAAAALREISTRAAGGATDQERAHRRAVRDEIERFLSRPEAPAAPPQPLPIPQGDPIGG